MLKPIFKNLKRSGKNTKPRLSFDIENQNLDRNREKSVTQIEIETVITMFEIENFKTR